MIPRRLNQPIQVALIWQAAVAVIGPRQVGKTTLALDIAKKESQSIYLDLESRQERAKLADPMFLKAYENQLVILDEIHRVPNLFQKIQELINERRRHGSHAGRFLMLASASRNLLQSQTSNQPLMGPDRRKWGRIEYVTLCPLDVLEVTTENGSALNRLWVRGGFPDSYLEKNDMDSLKLRKGFIRTYIERDVAHFAQRMSAEMFARLWTMLAHNQGAVLNASRLASGLSISAPTVNSYIDLLVDLLLVRRLPPLQRDVGKRLIKSPKVYVRDSGLLHALLNIGDYNQLCGHPVVGPSWEGFVIENLLAAAPDQTVQSFYRTAAGAEIDLVLQLPGTGASAGEIWAIEINRGQAAKVDRGFHIACDDIKPTRRFVVGPGDQSHPLSPGLQAIGLKALASMLAAL